jgi:hypothetical protein
MLNPWDQLPAPQKGDDSEDITFCSIGRALTRWETLDIYLAILFSYLVGIFTPSAIRAYGSLGTFSGKLAMIREAGKAFITLENAEHIQTDFDKLMNLSEKYSARRNEIAHGIVISYSQEMFFHQQDKEGFVLVPNYHNAKKQTLVINQMAGVPKFVYSSKEIDHYKDRFEELTPLALHVIQEVQKSNRFVKTAELLMNLSDKKSLVQNKS